MKPETIEKIKTARAKQIIKHSRETKDKIGKAHKGKTVSPETKEKLRKYNTGKKYSSSVNSKKASIGENNPAWKGGRHYTSRGYVSIRVGINKYRLEHRVVMETFLNRKLQRTEIIHHINNILSDNRIENLILFKNQAEHIKHHKQIRQKAEQP